MKRVVVDTNVLISSTLSSKGNPYKIMSHISDREVQLYYCPGIIDEYMNVLAYQRLNIAHQTQRKIIKEIERLGILIEPPVSTIPLPDETDRKFYDTARASEAILVTGNTKHYPDENFIMTPAQYIEKYNT